MTPLCSIARMRAASLWNRVRSVKADSVAKVGVVVFGLGTVLGISFWVSFASFRFIEELPAFGTALNAKVISLLFLTLLVLVVLSTIIVTYTTIFLARETDFLFQHPIPPRTILGVKLAEAIAFSSWATLVLCLPVLVAYGCLRRAGTAYYLETAAVLGVFLLFAGFLGTAIAMAIAPIVRLLSGRQLLVASGAVLGGLGFLFLRSFNFWDMDGENDLLILDRFMSQISTMHSPYFPGQWAAGAVLAAASGSHAEVAFQGGTLLANTLVFLPLFSWYGARWYGRQWIAVRGGRSRGPARARRAAGAPRRNLRPAPSDARARGPLGAMVLKDILVFVRDPSQLSQSILFILLMVVYSLSLMRIPEFPGKLQVVIYFANLIAVCTILSSFTSRFLFPLVSLEGKAFWIVGLAPVSRGYLVLQKAAFGLGVSGTLGLLTIIASNASLGSPPAQFAGAVYATILAGVCLTFLATGLGAAYPVFDEDNPARIAVGMGGTLNFISSALAVAVLAGIEALPYVLLGQEPPLPWLLASHAGATAFTAGVALVSFRLGASSLRRRDF